MTPLSELPIEVTQRAGELWVALMKDISAEPCQFPCLRDDLIDWFRHHVNGATPTVEASR